MSSMSSVWCLILCSCVLSSSGATLPDLQHEKGELREKLSRIFPIQSSLTQRLVDNLMDNTFAEIVKKSIGCPDDVAENTRNSDVKCNTGTECVYSSMCKSTNPSVACDTGKVCCRSAEKRTCGNRKIPNPSTTAERNEASFAEFPWMMSVLDDQQRFLAGGALIAPDKVLTSAHIVNQTTAGRLRVRAGEWDRQSSGELYPHADRLVKQITVHPDAKVNNKYNDIALIQLSAAYRDLPHISPICLANSLDQLDQSNCFVTAWGSRSQVLRSFPLATLPTTDCESQLRAENILWFGPFIRENLLCAAAQPNIESCGLDDGSPLFCPYRESPQQYALVGLVNCGWRSARLRHTQLPGIYSNVMYFADWINGKLVDV